MVQSVKSAGSVPASASGTFETRQQAGQRDFFRDPDVFDVPDEPYSEGFITGMRAASAMLEAVRDGNYVPWVLIVRAVCNVPPESGRSGAAAGFLHCLWGMIDGAARHLAFEAFIERELQAQAEERQTFLNHRGRHGAARAGRRQGSPA